MCVLHSARVLPAAETAKFGRITDKTSLSVRANDFRTDIYTIFECALSNGDACFVRRSRIMKR